MHLLRQRANSTDKVALIFQQRKCWDTTHAPSKRAGGRFVYYYSAFQSRRASVCRVYSHCKDFAHPCRSLIPNNDSSFTRCLQGSNVRSVARRKPLRALALLRLGVLCGGHCASGIVFKADNERTGDAVVPHAFVGIVMHVSSNDQTCQAICRSMEEISARCF
jgi:hypothetical protein